MEWPGRLETVQEVDIETRRADDAPVNRTTIWVVVTDGVAYIRSLRGEQGRWFRELMANPDAVLHVEHEPIPVRGVRTPTPSRSTAPRTGSGESTPTRPISTR